MRYVGTVFSLLLLGSLLGCTGTAPFTAVEAADHHPQSVNRFELHGEPDKLALLVDSETGSVWRYEQGKLVPVPTEGTVPPPGARIRDYTQLK